MVNKKPNEVAGWKSKLTALDGLPGEQALDTNEQWQQLHGRLQQQQGRRKVLWYWAAAGILLLFTSLLWTIHPKQSSDLPTVAAKQAYKKEALPPSSTEANDAMRSAAVLPTPANAKSAPAASPKQKDTVRIPIPLPQAMALAETVAVAKALPVVLPADTQLVAAVAKPLPIKQKLKVVHINELNYPAPAAPRIYAGQDYSVHQNRFINQPVYSTVSPNTGGIQFTISSSKKNATN